MEQKGAYVDVLPKLEAEGKLIPLRLVWEDGTRLRIDRVLEVQPGGTRKNGNGCDRYTVSIGGKRWFLTFERFPITRAGHVGRWFVEPGK